MPELPVLSWLNDRFNDWGENVLDDKILGQGLRVARQATRLGGPSMLGMLVNNPLISPSSADADAADKSGLMGKAWVDQAYRNSPWQHFAANAALDPLNLVGVGLPTKALSVVPAGGKLYKALKVAEAADTLPGKVTAPVFDLAGKGVGKAVEGAVGFAKPHADEFARLHPNVSAGIDNVMRGWREQALLSPGYHVRNAVENVIRPVLDNGDWQTAGDTVKGMFTGKQRFDVNSHGMNMDPDVLRAIGVNPMSTAPGVPSSVFRKLEFKPPTSYPGPNPPPLPRWKQGVNAVTDKLSDAMELNQRFGTTVESKARKAAIMTQYERSIASGASHNAAVKDAIEYADRLFFDYTKNGAVDDLGKNLFAFHKFQTHNLPAQLKASGRTPGLMNVPSQYYRDSDEYNAQHGLPSRFHGELPIGNTGWNVNPLALWSMGQLVGAGSKRTANDDEGTWLGEVGDTAQGMGLGLNPFIDALLTVTGQHGRSFAPSFLRASQPVNGVLSSLMDRPVDIEGGPKELLGKLQEGITGQRPFPYQEYLLNKRRAELRDLGGDPSKAGQDVGDQMAAEGLAGFIGIPGLKQLTPEEQTIRQNSALAKAYSLVGNQAGYKANPTARTYADLDPRDEQARLENFLSLSASERHRLFRDPEVREELFTQLAQQLHNTPGKGKSNPNPFMRAKSAPTASPTAAQAKATASDYQQAKLMIQRMQAQADAVQARQKR